LEFDEVIKISSKEESEPNEAEISSFNDMEKANLTEKMSS